MFLLQALQLQTETFSLVDVRFCENEWETAFAHFHRVVLKTVSKEI
jgi:hypothetical protein